MSAQFVYLILHICMYIYFNVSTVCLFENLNVSSNASVQPACHSSQTRVDLDHFLTFVPAQTAKTAVREADVSRHNRGSIESHPLIPQYGSAVIVRGV